MKIFRHLGSISIFLTGILFASCAGLPAPPERLPPTVPEDKRQMTLVISGRGNRTVKELADFLQQGNKMIPREKAEEFARLYREEAEAEEINHDIAFCQMVLETGFLSFQGTVKPEQNNFCGLGTVSADVPGESFPTIRLGVRAHIQHLKAYGSTGPLRNEIVDRRFKYVKRGSAPTIYDLAGKWASDPQYGIKIHGLLKRLFDNGEVAKSVQIRLFFADIDT